MRLLFGNKKSPLAGANYRKGIDKSKKIRYNKGVGATDDGASSLYVKKDNRKLGRLGGYLFLLFK